MRIGVAREIKPDEHRVALTPAGARELAQKGHEVVVERGAGEGSALPDAAYEAVGARIASVDDVWGSCDLVLKVKEPLAAEFDRLREGLILFTYLHLAADEALTRTLLDSGAICIAYETVETDDRQLPLLAPMSEVAGRLATQMGAWALEKAQSGPAFKAKFKKRFNADADAYAASYYDQVLFIGESMKKANSIDPDKVGAELYKTTYKGVAATYSYDDKGNMKQAPITVFTFKNAAPVPLASY